MGPGGSGALPRDRIGERPPSSRRTFALCYLPILAAAIDQVLRGADAAHWPALVGLCLGSVAWALAVRLAWLGAGDHRLVLAGALLLRAVLLAATPSLSDDLERYVWEGAVVASGRSPYAHAPDDPRLADLRVEMPSVAAGVNHPSVSAAYPPLAQLAFASVVGLARRAGPAGARAAPAGEGLEERARRSMRAFFTLCDLMVLWPLAHLLRRLGRPSALIVAWGWSPLAGVAFAADGHLDSLAIAFLVAGLALWPSAGIGGREEAVEHSRERWWPACAWLAASAATKLVPLLLLPGLLRGRGSSRRAAAIVATVAASYAAAALLQGGTTGLGRGLVRYGIHWEANSLVVRWLRSGIEHACAGSATLGWLAESAWLVARAASALLALWLVVRIRRSAADAIARAGTSMGWLLVLSPTLHPWYWTWMLPFVAARPRASWTWLVISAPLGYWPVARWRELGGWIEPPWVWALQVLPFVLLLWLEARRERRTVRG